MIEKHVFIPFSDYYIPGIWVFPDDVDNKVPAVLLMHGLLSYKNGDGFLFPLLAQKLAEKGIASLRIDFCSMGESRAPRRFYCASRMLEEAKTAYSFMKSENSVDENSIFILGHSLGATIARHLVTVNPCGFISLNGALALFDTDIVVPEYIGEDYGLKYTINHASLGRSELVYETFFNDQLMKDSFPEYNGPEMIVVALKDPTVPPHIGLDYYEACENPLKQLITVENCDHNYNLRKKDYSGFNQMCVKLIDWLKELV